MASDIIDLSCSSMRTVKHGAGLAQRKTLIQPDLADLKNIRHGNT